MKPILYNITFKIAEDFLDHWLQWIHDTFIRLHMDTGLFTEYKILRIIGGNDGDGSTYAIQFVANNIVEFQKFASSTALDIQKEQGSFCGESALSFSTTMEIIG